MLKQEFRVDGDFFDQYATVLLSFISHLHAKATFADLLLDTLY